MLPTWLTDDKVFSNHLKSLIDAHITYVQWMPPCAVIHNYSSTYHVAGGPYWWYQFLYRLKERILSAKDQMDTINPTTSSQICRPRRLGTHVIGCNAYVTYNNTRDRGPGWLLDSSQYPKIRKTEFQSNPSRIA